VYKLRLNIYLDKETYELIKKGSAIEERSLSKFLAISGKRRAKKILGLEDEEWANN
jgi:uncharacterized protein (DUF1778 family)